MVEPKGGYTNIFPFFLYVQNRIYVFFTNAEQQDNCMKRVAILFLLIFNELQENYMEMEVNFKTIIFNELQLYEMNCSDIKKENQENCSDIKKENQENCSDIKKENQEKRNKEREKRRVR